MKLRTLIGMALVAISLFLIPYTQVGAMMFAAAGIAISIYIIIKG